MPDGTTPSHQLDVSDFVHLHNHTHHSLLDGLTKVPELVSRVKDMGMHAVAVTDHGTLSGAIEFYKACTDQGIKPIIGMEAYVAARSRTDRDPAKDKARYHLIIIAMNNTGYQNLMQLSTLANLEGMYYKPRIDHELLEKYNEGLIILSGCASSEISEAIRADDFAKAKETALWYKSVFGDRYYFEVQDSTWDVQEKINSYLFTLSEEIGVPCVLTSDAHYVEASDTEAHEILLCVGTGAFLSDEDRMSLKDFHLHVTNPREIMKRWEKSHADAIRNTKLIADRCQVDLEFGKILIPTFPVPQGETEQSYLHSLVWRGLAWRYGSVPDTDAQSLTVEQARQHVPQEVAERADYELGVIEKMGFNGYFLIIWDFIKWGKDRGIIFGPGRGSAARPPRGGGTSAPGP